MVEVSHADFQQLAKSLEESMRVIALAAPMGAMVTAASVDFERGLKLELDGSRITTDGGLLA